MRKSKRRGFEGPSAVHDAIRDLVEHKSSSSEELSRRAGQMKTLAEMAQIIRALMIRAETGSLSQSALDSTTPPKVKQLAPRGTEASYEYIRTTLQMIRPVVVKLYVENHALTKKVRQMESELKITHDHEPEKLLDHGSTPLTLDQLGQVLGAMGLCDSELEDLGESSEVDQEKERNT